MSGIALSGFYMTRHLDRIEKDSHLFLKIEIVIILFSFLFPFVFSIPSQYLEDAAISLLIYPVFLIMSFFSGAWIGLQFPLASKIYLASPGKGGTLGRTAGHQHLLDAVLLQGAHAFPQGDGHDLGDLKESCFM